MNFLIWVFYYAVYKVASHQRDGLLRASSFRSLPESQRMSLIGRFSPLVTAGAQKISFLYPMLLPS